MKIVNAVSAVGLTVWWMSRRNCWKRRSSRVCLQPIVENAISMDWAEGGGGCISVKIRRRERDIIFAEVEDDGVGMEPDRLEEVREEAGGASRRPRRRKNGNVGLKNIHDRLQIVLRRGVLALPLKASWERGRVS